MTDSIAVRSGNAKSRTGKKATDLFHLEFDANYAQPLCTSHINLLMRKRSQFVATKVLNSSLQFLTNAIKNKSLYKNVCQPNLQTILLELTLPLLLTSEFETRLWSEDPIEYVRLQVDNSNSWNVKRTNSNLVRAICNIR
jgi:hypothetical protein